MKRPARRSIIKLLLLLAAGAALNVVVAWGYSTHTVPDEEWLRDDALLRRFEDQHQIQTGMVGARRSSSMRLLEIRGRINGERCVIQHIVAGWPLLAFSGTKVGRIDPMNPNGLLAAETHWAIGTDEWDRSIFSNTPQILPLRPLWPGFAINTVFYAGVLWGLWCGPFALRRMIRRRRGRCPHCAYPIGQSPVCTECGAAVSNENKVVQ